MKFEINSKALLDKVRKLNMVVADNPILPITEAIHLEVQGDKLALRATNMENTLITQLDEVKVINEGSIALTGKLLYSLLSELPDQPIAFDATGSTCNITSSSGSYQLSVYESKDFPQIPELDDVIGHVDMDGDLLIESLYSVNFAIASDKITVDSLRNVLFDFRDGFEIVATNAACLSKCKISGSYNMDGNTTMLSKKSCALIKEIRGNLKITVDKKNTLIANDEYTLICRNFEGKYPDYKNILSKPSGNQITVSISDLQRSLNMVKSFSMLGDPMTDISFKKGLIYVESVIEPGQDNLIKESIKCECDFEDTIRVNASFLSSSLSVIGSEQVSIYFNKKNKPLIITSDEEDIDKYIMVMPFIQQS